MHNISLFTLQSETFSRYQVKQDEGFDNILVVDGVPIIGKDKLDKLLTKICKEFSKKGVTIKSNDIHIPWDELAGKSKGYITQNLVPWSVHLTCTLTAFSLWNSAVSMKPISP